MLPNCNLGAAEQKYCEHCGVTISYMNWSYHIKTKKRAEHALNVETECMTVNGLKSSCKVDECEWYDNFFHKEEGATRQREPSYDEGVR